jgi:hypothetical protein
MQQLETISQIGNDEIQPIENEIHAFLASLRQVKFYGELTLYFQNGNIEHCRTVSRIAKKDLIKAYQKPLDTSEQPQHRKIIIKAGQKLLTPVKGPSSHKKIIVKAKHSLAPKEASCSKQDDQLPLFALTELPAVVIPRGGSK